MERYAIRTSGRIEKGADLESALSSLASLFQKNGSEIRYILDGKSRILKKNLDWNSASKYHALIRKTGAQSEIQVMMDAQSLRTAIVKIDSTPQKKTPLPFLGDSRRFGFDRSKLSPLIFHPSSRVPLFNDKGKIIRHIFSPKAMVNKPVVFIIFASLLLFLFITQTSSLVDRFPILLNTTTTSILLLEGAILTLLFFLIEFVFPRAEITLCREENDESPTFLYRQISKSLSPWKNNVAVDGDGQVISKMHRNMISQKFECKTNNGTLIYSASEESQVDDIAIDAATEMLDQLVDMSFLGLIDLAKAIRTKNVIQNIFVIRDAAENPVGHFARARFSILSICKDDLDQDEMSLLFAFSFFLAGI